MKETLLYFERVCPAGRKQSRPSSLGFGFLGWAQALAVCRLQEVVPCSCMEHFQNSDPEVMFWRHFMFNKWQFNFKYSFLLSYEPYVNWSKITRGPGGVSGLIEKPTCRQAAPRPMDRACCRRRMVASKCGAEAVGISKSSNQFFGGFWWWFYNFPGDFGGFTFFLKFWWFCLSFDWWCLNTPPSCWGEDLSLRTSPAGTTGPAGICCDNPQIHRRGEGAGWLRRTLDVWFKWYRNTWKKTRLVQILWFEVDLWVEIWIWNEFHEQASTSVVGWEPQLGSLEVLSETQEVGLTLGERMRPNRRGTPRVRMLLLPLPDLQKRRDDLEMGLKSGFSYGYILYLCFEGITYTSSVY